VLMRVSIEKFMPAFIEVNNSNGSCSCISKKAFVFFLIILINVISDIFYYAYGIFVSMMTVSGWIFVLVRIKGR